MDKINKILDSRIEKKNKLNDSIQANELALGALKKEYACIIAQKEGFFY
jgi:hypothetical protein